MKYLSLFSGIGAFESALKNLNIPFDLVGFSEIDKYAVKSYCAIHNVSETLNLGDITKIDETQLPKVDFITYGFPCQDISLAGKQQGLFNEDGSKTRSGLFFDALRLIEHTQPKVAIAENVKNLTSKKFAEQFQIVLNSLEEAGYNNYWMVLNSKDFGIPQNRERVFIVSIRKDCDTGIFEFPMSHGETTKSFYEYIDDNISEKEASECLLDWCDLEKMSDFGAGYRFGGVMVKGRIYNTIAANYGKINGNSGKFFRNHRVSCLTAKECFRLMGFKDEDFEKAEKVNSNTQLYKQAGNSIVVDVAEELLCMLFDEEGNFFI